MGNRSSASSVSSTSTSTASTKKNNNHIIRKVSHISEDAQEMIQKVMIKGSGYDYLDLYSQYDVFVVDFVLILQFWTLKW